MRSETVSSRTLRITYDDTVVRAFLLASVIWGAVAMLVGVIIALQLNFWQVNLETSYLSFGRLRPLHTNAAIFALVGNMMFAGIYHSTQRLCRVRLASDALSWIHFWGWQAIIVLAAVTLPLGLTRGKEYAELIWPINILVVIIWVVFAINFFWTLAKRHEPTLYVAIWFYIATIITIAMLYIVNHLSIPTSWLHSYPVFAGVHDALVQWWYGHNAVAFFLTTPILGIMYYYLPKAAERPVYSYRLSIIHFWSLVFVYIWAGPHHLLNTALPNWLQTLGMLFSLMLWAPSWGGMINGLLTLRGAWDKVRTDPVLKFFVAAITFYGMATFEGPLLSIKSVNALAHYSDWIIGHVHLGTLGWNGFMAAGMFYWMAPRLWGVKLHSIPLANLHFWTGMVGILLYVASMWVSGITQGLMLNATTPDGTALAYPNFLDTLQAIKPLMLFRVAGGALYLFGWILMCYNLYQTIRAGKPVTSGVDVVVEEAQHSAPFGLRGTFINAPVFYCVAGLFFGTLWWLGGDWGAIPGFIGLTTIVLAAIVHFQAAGVSWGAWYDRLLASGFGFTVLTLLAAAAGGIIQIIPTVTFHTARHVEDRLQVPPTPLELIGRDIYVREGCYTCHSQMIRTLLPDIMRYGEYSRLGESIYDRPYQWGSRRAGPDLAREGGLRTDLWHLQHFLDPRSVSPQSTMPAYPWLFNQSTNYAAVPAKIRVLRRLGVPYPQDWSDADVIGMAEAQAESIAAGLADQGEPVPADRELIAMIAYLQQLGRWEAPPAPNTTGND